MPTSGTWTFNLDLGEMMEEAFERCGLELRTGYQYKTARRSLNLLSLEWQNRGLNLFTVKEASLVLTPGTIDYPLPAERFDVIEVVLRKFDGAPNQFDRTLKRKSLVDYAHQSAKLTQNEPNTYTVEKDPAQITLKLWPVPDSATTYTLVYWYLERIEDAGASASNNMDIPPRFIPVLAAGLAYHIGMKNPKLVDMNLRALLQKEYGDQWTFASDADREKATLRIVPRRKRI